MQFVCVSVPLISLFFIFSSTNVSVARQISGTSALLRVDAALEHQHLQEQQLSEKELMHCWSAEWATLERMLLEFSDTANSTLVEVLQLQLSSAATAAATRASFLAVGKQADLTNNSTGTLNPSRDGPHAREVLQHKKLNPKSVADLVPALAMLKGLYEDSKQRIVKLNAREQKSKDLFAEQRSEHNATLARIQARCSNHTLKAEFCTNETKMEMRFFKYWTRVRERQHHGYHTSLNIVHGMMSRVKALMDLYEKAMTGKDDDATMIEQIQKIAHGADSNLALLETRCEDAVQFCHDSLGKVRCEQESLNRSE